MWNLSQKLEYKYFLKIFVTVWLSFFCLNLFANILFPHVILYMIDLGSLFQLFLKNMKLILLTLIFLLLAISTIRSIYKKLLFLFSEETTVMDIFNDSEDFWKKGEYDKVYDNLNYIYQSIQKDRIVNNFTMSTESILLFQKCNLNDHEINKDTVYDLTSKLLSACMMFDHYLNTIHLAYSFAHLAKFEQEKQQKAAFHLISAILFYYADPLLHKSEFEFERRIYHYYVRHFPNLRVKILENELETLMSGITRTSDHFKSELIPYMKQILKENAVV